MVNILQQKISCDIALLNNYAKNQYINVPFEISCKLIKHKNKFKEALKNNLEGYEEFKENYLEFKKKIKELRTYKLPFRLIEIIKHNLKYKCGIPPTLKEIYSENTIDKAAIQSSERKLIEQFNTQKDILGLAESIHWVHGTNSSIFPLLPLTGMTFISTGSLLDIFHIAPMGGETKCGGTSAIGVNQTRVSVETIRNLSRAYNYAKTISNTFEPAELENAESYFNKMLSQLEQLSPQSESWDPCLINLYRLKQWQPEIFTSLCKKYATQIEKVKLITQANCFGLEGLILKALAYDTDKLRKASRDKQAYQELCEDFKEIGEIYGKNWISEWNAFYDPLEHSPSLNYFIRNFIQPLREKKYFYYFRNNIHEAIECIFCLKLYGNKEIDNFINNFAKVSQENRTKWSFFLNKIDGKPTTELFLDKIVKETISSLIQKTQGAMFRRHQRMINLFEKHPLVKLDERAREFITAPFPIIVASTNSKSTLHHEGTEYNVKKAALGNEANILFVQPQDQEKVQEWLAKFQLSEKVKVVSTDTLEKLFLLPLYHAPQQVQLENLFISVSALKTADQIIRQEVVPLYKAPYPDGSPRLHHGVAHSVGTAFFGSIIAEMYYEADYRFRCSPEDLIIGLSLHDSCRERDLGKDLWDDLSGKKTAEIVTKILQRSAEQADFISKVVGKKDDKNPFAVEQKVVHDGDCTEINRCLNRPEDFNPEELWINKDLDKNTSDTFIDEAKKFIALRERPAIKSFIENCTNPFAVYFEILNYAHEECNQFPLLYYYGKKGIVTLGNPHSVSQLTTEIFAEIKKYLQ